MLRRGRLIVLSVTVGAATTFAALPGQAETLRTGLARAQLARIVPYVGIPSVGAGVGVAQAEVSGASARASAGVADFGMMSMILGAVASKAPRGAVRRAGLAGPRPGRVLEKGETRFSGPAREILERGDLVRSVFLSGARDQVQAAARNGETGAGDRTFRTFDIAGLVHSGKTRATLCARGLRKSFGGVTAVDDVDLDIRPGEIVGLMGPNGAGKTTVLDVLSGFVAPDAVLLLDEPSAGLARAEAEALSPVLKGIRQPPAPR